MKLLLDTHVWVWVVGESDRVSARVREVLDDDDNEFWLSPVSIWEAMILHRKGRLEIPEGFTTWRTRALTTMPLQEASLTFEVAAELATIKLPHADPADLFLAATAKVYGLTLITSDRNLIQSKTIPVIKN